jgi:hypothetical protein
MVNERGSRNTLHKPILNPSLVREGFCAEKVVVKKSFPDKGRI